MSLEQNALLNAYSLAILLIIYFHARRSLEHGNLSDRLYMWLLHTTALLLGLDVLSRFDGNASPPLCVVQSHRELPDVSAQPGLALALGSICSLSGTS
jgi:hypothetical protein